MAGIRDVFGGDSLGDIVNVFFNGSKERGPARNQQTGEQATIAKLIERKTSVVKSGGKLYRFTVTEVDLSKL